MELDKKRMVHTSAVVSLCGLASDIYRSYKILASVKVLSATSQ